MEVRKSSRSRDKRKDKHRKNSRDKEDYRSSSRKEVRSRHERHYREREQRFRSRSPIAHNAKMEYATSRRSYSTESDNGPDIRERCTRDTSEYSRFTDRCPRDSTDKRNYANFENSRDASKYIRSFNDNPRGYAKSSESDSVGPRDSSDEQHSSIAKSDSESVSSIEDSKGKVHNVLINSWSDILKKGMPNQSTEEIIKKYSPPNKFMSLKPPTLNSEIKRTMTEKARKKDNFQVKAQEKIGAAILATGFAITNILEQGKDMDISLVTYLSDAARILADAHYNISITRRAFITPNVNRLVEPVESLLFGEKLSERLKSAREVEKDSKAVMKPVSNIKSNFFNKVAFDRPYKNQRSSYAAREQVLPSRQLNYRGPSGAMKRNFKSRQDGQKFKSQKFRGRR